MHEGSRNPGRVRSMEANTAKFICRCQEITEEEIDQAIKDGATTIKGIKDRTEATMGLCQGRTCRRLIERMLPASEELSRERHSCRPPVRTVKIGDLLQDDSSKGERE